MNPRALGTCGIGPGDVDLDDAIAEITVRDDRQHGIVVGFMADARLQVDRSLTSIDHRLGAGSHEHEVVEVEGPFAPKGKTRGQRRDEGCGKEKHSHGSRVWTCFDSHAIQGLMVPVEKL